VTCTIHPYANGTVLLNHQLPTSHLEPTRASPRVFASMRIQSGDDVR